MASKTVTCNGVRYYNGGWSSSYEKPKTTYAGVHSNGSSTVTLLKFTIPAFTGRSDYITFYPYVTKGWVSSSTTSVRLRYAIRKAEANSTYGGKFGAITDSGAIKTGDVTFSGLTATREKKSFKVSTTSLSAGTYYMYLWPYSKSSGLLQFYDGGSSSYFWTATLTYTPTYKVSYNSNGGSGAPSSQTKYHGTNLTLSSTKPTKTGYDFTKWNTKSDGSGTNYSAGATYTANASVTLYAQYKKKTYTVKYNANGGSGAPSSQTKTYGVSLTLSSTKPTRTGYTFQKWNTKSDGSGTNYSPGGTYTANAAVTLYAVWKINTYTVKYNANGGSGAPANQTKTYGKNLTLSSTKPTRTGHTFRGWSTTKKTPTNARTTSDANYQAGATYSANSSVTLYAVWDINIFTVTFNKNSDSATGSMDDIKITYGVEQSLPSIGFTRSGYSFKGWHLYRKSDNKWLYSVNSAIKWYTSEEAASLNLTTEDRKLYANKARLSTTTAVAGDTIKAYVVWGKSTYTLTINPNGGSYNDSTSKTTVSDVYNSSLTLDTPTRSYYTFNKWEKVSGSGTLSGNVFKFGAGNAEIRALWKIIQHTVTFNATANGGKCSTTSKKINHGSAIGSLPAAVKNNYIFRGWNTKSDGSGTTYTSSKVINTDVTLYAIFEYDAPVACVLTIDPNDGTYNGSTDVYTIKAVSGDTYTVKNPIRTNYKFSRWKIESVGSYTFTNNVFTFGSGATILTAEWEVETAVITFNASINGGQCEEKTRKVSLFTPIGPLPDATRGGHTFLGWYTNSEGTGSPWTENTDVMGNVTLYAVFKTDVSMWQKLENGNWVCGVPNVNIQTEYVRGTAKYNKSGTWVTGIGPDN